MPLGLRTAAGRLIRRLGILPGGVADGIGEDDQLTDVVLTSRVAVFFPDPPENIYQLRQWYAPFEALHDALGVTILVQDSRTAASVRRETHIPVLAAARTRTVGALLSDGAVRLVLYVGQANANASGLRVPDVLHVFLNHGDSDKFVSVSNQVKAFDRCFVAGAAAVDRHADGLMLYDAKDRLRVIGRPQLPALASPSGAFTVLYAPTWEGTMAVNAYSSVLGYGEPLVDALLADGDVHVIYRPHPRTGRSDSRFKDADARIRAAMQRHGDRALVDVDPDPSASFARSHVMIADVSAIAVDWLGQRRPIVSTVPVDPKARIASPARLFASTPHIDAATAGDAVAIARAAASDAAAEATISELAEYYIGGLTAHDATAAFIAACEEAIADCERERSRRGMSS